jgi:hypothetical protein
LPVPKEMCLSPATTATRTEMDATSTLLTSTVQSHTRTARSSPGHADAYFWVDKVDELYGELVGRAADIVHGPVDQDYGLQEFAFATKADTTSPSVESVNRSSRSPPG